MDLNQIRALAGLPSKPLALAAPVIVEEKLPEAKVIREDEKTDMSDRRQRLIEKIESYFGTLESIPYSKVSTADLTKMYETLLDDKLVTKIKG
jgi:hypothetical protein